jgi:hypothetical protein
VSPVTDLDLTAEIIRIADDVCRRHANGGDRQAVTLANLAAALVTEVEHLRRPRGSGFPSSDAYENAVQALADERAEVVRLCDEVRDLRALLAEILAYFPTGPVDPGFDVRSTSLRAETLDRWRSHLGGQS